MSFKNYYDTSYGRSRPDTSVSRAERSSSVTAKYINTSPSYKTSSIPIRRERSTSREQTESPITAIANKYANYKIKKDDKPTPKYIDKKDSYNKLTVPIHGTKSRDVSPVSTSSKYSINRTSSHRSPDRRVTSSSSLTKGRSRDPSPSDRDKDIPNKTDKSTGYNSLSSYKIYPRSSAYTRPTRTEIKPEITVNRYAIANRLSSNYLRGSSTEKKRLTSLSPIHNNDVPRIEINRSFNSINSTLHNDEPEFVKKITVVNTSDILNERNDVQSPLLNGHPEIDKEEESITVVTRHTSPTPPGSSAYVRSRRAELAKTVEKIISRSKTRPQMIDKEIQSDRLDDTTRCSRFGSTARSSVTNWTTYSPNGYTGYAGRYSTQYIGSRESPVSSNGDKQSSPSRNLDIGDVTEIVNYNSTSDLEINKMEQFNKEIPVTFNKNEEKNHSEILQTNEQNKDDEPSEIIINVNLKLKKAKDPLTNALVSPEITITNSLLPPQAPKTEVITKPKKLKIRKSSTDSSSDSSISKKKVVKKRSKSVNSTDSESNEGNINSKTDSPSTSPPKVLSKSYSNNNIVKSKSKSRASDSPESSLTLSTQSSISEDDTVSKSKTADISRTSADESSIPLDRSRKQSSPPISQRNEGTQEAKSFLIRALAPVTSLFKMRNPPESADNSHWLDNSISESTGKDVSNLLTESDLSNTNLSNTDIIASNSDNFVKLKSVKRIESGERAWWLDGEKNSGTSHSKQKSPSEKNIQIKIKQVDSGEHAWWLEANNSESKNEKQILKNENSDAKSSLNSKFATFDREDKPWWMDSNSANIPEGVQRLTPPRKVSNDSEKSDKYDFYKVRHNESGEKDWWLTSNENSCSNKESQSCELTRSSSDQRSIPLRRIRHIESGERPWWLSSGNNIPEGVEKLPTPSPTRHESDSSDSEEVRVYTPSKPSIPPFPLSLPGDEPLGDRRSPEGLETPREEEDCRDRHSPYENNRQYGRNVYLKDAHQFISRYSDIDDILGTSGQMYSPFMDLILARRTGQAMDMSECEEIDATQVRIHDSTAQRPVIKKIRSRSEIVDYREDNAIDDAALQVFKDGDFGPYLDLDSTIREQAEELSGVQDSRKNAIVLRTQLSVRVHAIIERLLHAQGRELRKALFTFKQILQSDKDLVHEFVASNGLDCLMEVGTKADQNYLDYILRALGQILLYVDGMHGVMKHETCIQWLYTLIASKFRHVVKTTLKLLLVFVEYTEKNCLQLIEAVKVVDNANGKLPWHNIMKILQDTDASDTELLIYATNLINRCLNNIPEKESYYEQVDAIRAQGMDDLVQIYMKKQGTDLDLLRQLQIFEAVFDYENGNNSVSVTNLLEGCFVNPLRRKNNGLLERRKSKRQPPNDNEYSTTLSNLLKAERDQMANHTAMSSLNDGDDKQIAEVLKRRREKCQNNRENKSLYLNNNNINNKHKDIICDVTNGNYIQNGDGVLNGSGCKNGVYDDEKTDHSNINRKMKDLNIAEDANQYTSGLKQRIQNGTLGHSVNALDTLSVMRQNGTADKESIIQANAKEIAQRLSSPVSPTSEDKSPKVGELVVGIVSKAKEELAKSQSKEIIKSPTKEIIPKIIEIKRSENELHWEALEKECLNRKFELCDLDFSDLQMDTDDDVPSLPGKTAGVPPPPPTMFALGGAPPPPPGSFNFPPAPPSTKSNDISTHSDSSSIKKNKKTVKLFWREIQENPIPVALRDKVGGFIWDDLPYIEVDTALIEQLFEAKTNDLIIKKLTEQKWHDILDAKRSNAINIAMKKLPTAQTIKAAIMKMDATIIGREDIEKLLTMLPSEEEIIKIQEAQYANPDLPLGSAEQFLLTLASISELSSRLKLLVFKMDFDNLEKEIVEPLMDLKISIEQLRTNKTFKRILSVLRTVGCFLNGSQVKGFRLEYLAKVIDVKDTIHKNPLLYYVCEMVNKKFPESTDFYSEVGPVLRASKVDFQALSSNLSKLEADCKASWDHMKRVAKHDSSQTFKTKINEFLTDATQRIILLCVIQKKIMRRYNKLLLYSGVPPSDFAIMHPTAFLKIISEFALEYRTSRERMMAKCGQKERNKTRGKMIVDIGNLPSKKVDDADSALRELLKKNADSEVRTVRKKANRSSLINSEITADDDFLENLVKSASTKRRTTTRKRARLSENYNLNRTLDGTKSWSGKETERY